MILFGLGFLILSCGRSTNKTEDETKDTSSTGTEETFSPEVAVAAGTKAEKEAQLTTMINMTKQTMDSIDAAYTTIRSSSRLMNLSLEEREDVNEALQNMNVAKELIILQTQKEIIDQLRLKTNSLNSVIDHINKTSERLNNISKTISRISNIIEKTTNLLASGFTMGIIKPKTEVVQN
jgi:ABC-type transporter Mla subunit MlaD